MRSWLQAARRVLRWGAEEEGTLPAWLRVPPWVPGVTLLGALVAEVFAAYPSLMAAGLSIIVVTVVLTVPIAGPVATIVSASIGAVYFAYFVPEPSSAGGSVVMTLVPGLFALAPIVAALRPVLAAVRADATAGERDGADERAIDRLLQEAGALTDASFSYRATLDRLARLPVPVLADWVAIYELPPEGGAGRRVAVAAGDRSADDALEHALAGAPLRINVPHPLAAVQEVLRTGHAHTEAPAGPALESVGRDAAERLLLHRLEPAQIHIAPLHARGRLLGAMVFARARARLPYADADLATLADYCRRAALAIDNARLFDSAISSRAEAEGARERLVAILDDLSSGFIALDADGRVTHVNRAAERMTGRDREALLRRSLWHELPPHTAEAPLARFTRDALRRGTSATTELSVAWTGEARWLEINVSPSREGASLYIRDVTERRGLASALEAREEELRQSQKMEAVGRLAGGVAHDFNNLLMSIAGYAELLMQKAGPDHDMAEDIREILRATDRASSVTRQLLTYSRKQVHQPQHIRIGMVVSEMQRSLLRLLGEDIVLVVNSEDEQAPIFADPGQIEQILLNLAVNARDAMPGGGVLTITTGNAEVRAGRDEEETRLAPGQYSSLEVTDTGIGIAPAALPHIFEPFFTTKASGKGTGLGLASVYGIVRQNHGAITVSSRPNRGATFRILFPVAESQQLASAPAVSAPPPAAVSEPVEPAEADAASGVILVAEDEASVRRFVCQVLRSAGYTVLEARTGVDGLSVARRHADAIDLVLTDVVMPEMGGRGLAERMIRERPGMRILFMSGYAEDEIAHHGVLASGVQMLEKPFSAATLRERVRASLAAPPSVVRFSTPAA